MSAMLHLNRKMRILPRVNDRIQQHLDQQRAKQAQAASRHFRENQPRLLQEKQERDRRYAEAMMKKPIPPFLRMGNRGLMR